MLTAKTVLTVFLFGATLFQGSTNYKITGRYPIGGAGGFDYVIA